MVKKTWCMIKMNIIFADCVHIYWLLSMKNCSLMCPHLIFGNYIVHSPRNENFNLLVLFNFYTPVLRPHYVIGYGGWAGIHTGFRTITLVLYIRFLPTLATWFPCGRGRTPFILESLPVYRLIIYIDGRIMWCTHFLFKIYFCRNLLE